MMRCVFIFLGGLAIIAPARAPAAVVVRTWPNQLVGTTRDKGTVWRTNDYVCARQPRPPKALASAEKPPYIACGQVVRTTLSGLVLNLPSPKVRILAGTRLDLEKVDRATFYQSGLLPRKVTDAEEPTKRRSVSGGLNYTSGGMHAELGITRAITLGAMASLFYFPAGDARLTGNSFYATASIYSDRLFHGLWGIIGAGFSLARATKGAEQVGQSVSSPLFMMAAGWKTLHSSGWNIGAAAGAQYFMNRRVDAYDLRFSGLVPTAIFHVGHCF